MLVHQMARQGESTPVNEQTNCWKQWSDEKTCCVPMTGLLRIKGWQALMPWVKELKPYLQTHWAQIKEQLLEGKYEPQPVLRVEIPKPGGKGMRKLGIPTVLDRLIQQAILQVLTPLYDPHFSEFSFGFRPGRSAHQALKQAKVHMAKGKRWVVDMDLEKFFDEVHHDILMGRIAGKVKDKRILGLIRRYFTAGIMAGGLVTQPVKATPQGGPFSVLLSNIYLHYVLDLWFERVVKPLLEGEAYIVRYIDDFVLCFQYHSDALRVQAVLSNRLDKFGLALAPSKTKLVEFGRFAQTHAGKRGRKRPETIYFLGFTLYCTRNRKGKFKVGFRTEKTRLHRSLYNLCDLMRRMRHLPVKEQAINLNRVLRGHYAYYGVAGNFRCLQRVHRAVERYWYKMLCCRSRKDFFPWAIFHRIKKSFPLLRPRLVLLYGKLQAIAML